MLERFTEKNLYPYTRYYLRGVRERFGQYWKNHFSTIGLVGLNEACANLLGTNLGTETGQLFALRVLDFMREKLLRFQEESGNNYNLEATPAEGASYRLARIDAEKFPGIKSANETPDAPGAKPFYTNSSQLPVQYSDDIFEVLDLQDEMQTRYTGGTVQHLFIGRGDHLARERAKPREAGLRALPSSLLHDHPDLQHLPVARVPLGQAGNLSPLRRGRGGLLACRGIPAAGQPVERGQGGRVQREKDLQAGAEARARD